MRCNILHSSLLGLLIVVGCGRAVEESPLVARVYDHELHRADLVGLVGAGVAPEDSAAIVDNYIDQWVRQSVLLTNAERNIVDNFDRQLREYKNSLFIYAYEQQIVNQLMDTLVTDQQVADYYNQHRDDFRLRSSIVKVVYVVLPSKSPALSRMKLLINKHPFDDADIVALEESATQLGLSGFYDAHTWLPFISLQRSVPISTTNENSYLRQNRTVTVVDGELTYLVRILDYKLSDDISPLETQTDNIRSLILNHRKLDILQRMQADLMAEAERSDNIKRYI